MPEKPQKRPDSDIANLRREQIVEAAVAVIAAQGLPNLSLSEIEKRAGMSRGQLTYYFPAKEDILLAVFDRLLQLMYQRVGTPQGQPCEQASGWDWVQHLLQTVPDQPHDSPGFHTLQYTFLAQLGHREDFRRRLASLYEEWRTNMGSGLAQDLERRPPLRAVEPRALATLIQAILHGLAMQRAVDPQAFDHGRMLHLCVDLLGTYLWGAAADGEKLAAPATNNDKPPARPAAHGLQGTSS
ncbi:MAG: TetR/AcrR family transcriptional regulator [Planctomycetia bacterium]|nr:TetR/AcrR family transcriptional regulator [Planctomycetia bacterium]